MHNEKWFYCFVTKIQDGRYEQASGDAEFLIDTSAINAADKLSESVAVLSRDTDVFIILLAKMGCRNIFLLQTHPGKPNKFIDLNKLKSDLGQEICDVLATTTSRSYRM